MPKINFKRKKDGGDGAWGAGLDYLLKDYWDDLDKIVEDNYYGRHNTKLINFLFPKVFSVLKKAILLMEKHGSWTKKARVIQKFGVSAKSVNEKVIFIDTVIQFLRETYSGKIKIAKKVKEKKIIKKTEIKEIKGVIASAGSSGKKIRGTVKIVYGEKDFSKIKKGEILVADETDAAFLPIMRLAKAIITNEGGILCHAAIVARELKKPCITGTKIATQVLKDGDRVEIDAKEGIVKICRGNSIDR